jgi:hypothetical protein
MGSDDFLRIGDAARLLAFHLGQRFQSNGIAHLETARNKVLDRAKAGDFPIVAGTKSWSGDAAFTLPAECVHGLSIANIDWDESVFDASADAPVEATASVQLLHNGPATLWAPTGDFTAAFGIDAPTIGRWNRR